jgi:hypothetical protein
MHCHGSSCGSVVDSRFAGATKTPRPIASSSAPPVISTISIMETSPSFTQLSDPRVGGFPTGWRIVKKSGDFSEVHHSETMIFATHKL